MMPNIVNITEAAVHDRRGFESVVFPKDTIIVEDKGYWDFDIIKARVLAENYFVTRIKDNTVYEVVKELKLPENEDQHILLDEIIHLTGSQAKKAGIDEIQFRRVVAYHEEENTTIEIISNNLECENIYWNIGKCSKITNIYCFNNLFTARINEEGWC